MQKNLELRAPSREFLPLRLVGYSSGQRGETVNLLAYAFPGSNPGPTTTLKPPCPASGGFFVSGVDEFWK